jgi:hypothetical protein
MNPPAQLHWLENGIEQSVRWRSESGAPPPRRVVLADDTMGADAAYRLACEGTALLWRGDFHNARQMLQALARRADRKPRRSARATAAGGETTAPPTPAQAFHLHRQAQAQRARVLGMLIIPLAADYSVPLRRAPDFRDACTEAWDADARTARDGAASVVSLRELSGVVGAHEWRKKGVEVASLGGPGHNRIHPHHGVFSPVRGEYVDLVAQAPLPAAALAQGAADIGTGTGVLAAVLARRGLAVVATDLSPAALACAADNARRLGLQRQITLVAADLFPPRPPGRLRPGGVQPALGAGAGRVGAGKRGVRPRQPHAARLSGGAGGAAGAGRRGLAGAVRSGRAPGPAPARPAGRLDRRGRPARAGPTGHPPAPWPPAGRHRPAARRPCGGSHLTVAPGHRQQS